MAETRMVYVIRHGQTEWNLEGRLQGGKDSPLTPLGERQAKAAASSLKSEAPGAIVTSPIGRAKRTAKILADVFSIAMDEDPRLGEMRFGEAEGLTLAEVDQRWPGFREQREGQKWTTRWPEGESYQDVDARLTELCAERLRALLDDAAADPLAITGHETTNKVLLGRLLQLEPSVVTRLAQPNHVIYRLAGRRVDHAYVGDDALEWTPGLLQKRSDDLIQIAA